MHWSGWGRRRALQRCYDRRPGVDLCLWLATIKDYCIKKGIWDIYWHKFSKPDKVAKSITYHYGYKSPFGAHKHCNARIANAVQCKPPPNHRFVYFELPPPLDNACINWISQIWQLLHIGKKGKNIPMLSNDSILYEVLENVSQDSGSGPSGQLCISELSYLQRVRRQSCLCCYSSYKGDQGQY